MQSSLYERLGGKDAIVAVIDAFVGRAAGDGRINLKFARTDVPRLKAMLVDQVCDASGGPCTYGGRGMRETHTGMGVTAAEFNDVGNRLPIQDADIAGILLLTQQQVINLRKAARERLRRRFKRLHRHLPEH